MSGDLLAEVVFAEKGTVGRVSRLRVSSVGTAWMWVHYLRGIGMRAAVARYVGPR